MNSSTVDLGGLLASLLRAGTKTSSTITTTSLATATTDGESSPSTTDGESTTSLATHSKSNSQTTLATTSSHSTASSGVVSTTLSPTPDISSSSLEPTTLSRFSMTTTVYPPIFLPSFDPPNPGLSATPTTTSQPVTYHSSGVNPKVLISAIVVPVVLYAAIMSLCWRYFVIRKRRLRREQGASGERGPSSETVQVMASGEDDSFILPIDAGFSGTATTDPEAFGPTTQLQNIPPRHPSWKQRLSPQRQPPHAYPEDNCPRDEDVRSRRGLEMASLEDETVTRSSFIPQIRTSSSGSTGSMTLVSREEIMRDPRRRRRGVNSIDVMDHREWEREAERDEGAREMVEEGDKMMELNPERTRINWFGKEGKGGMVVAKSGKSSEELERNGYEPMNIELVDEDPEQKPDDLDSDQAQDSHHSLLHLGPHHSMPRLSGLFEMPQVSTSFPPSEMYRNTSPTRLPPHPESPPETQHEMDLGSPDPPDDSASSIAPKRGRNLHRKMADRYESESLGEVDLGLGWSRRQEAASLVNKEYRAVDEYRRYKLEQAARREREKEEGKGGSGQRLAALEME